MSIFYVKNSQIQANEACIEGDDVKHIRDVLRYKLNDEVNICDENGVKYISSIKNMEKEKISLNILEKCTTTSEPKTKITLFQGLPKSDKLELIIQKCTELGVSSVVPVNMDRSIVKIDEKNIDKKLERWNKIAQEASVQSGRQKVPTVEKPINIKNLIENISKYDILLLPYECEKECTLKAILRKLDDNYRNIAIIIGPEGGFSDEEIKLLNIPKVEKVTLGPRILRTETAGMATVAMILYELED